MLNILQSILHFFATPNQVNVSGSYSFTEPLLMLITKLYSIYFEIMIYKNMNFFINEQYIKMWHTF